MAMAFADLLNQEARELEAAGVDTVQFDEPAFNAFLKDTVDWGVEALNRACRGLKCTTAVHICYGYGIKANIDWKHSLGSEWRQYEAIFPALDYVDPARVFPCTNCGMAPLPRSVAVGKLKALGAGAALARKKLK